jgi:very-short-patch-repair endonuclease
MPYRRTDPKTFSHAHQLRDNSTEAETVLWQALRANRLDNVHFRRQHAIGPYIVDFCAPRDKIIIEVDGGQHLDQVEYDTKRTAYLEAQGYRVLRFWNDDVLKRRNEVLTVILEAVQHKA